jgi:hypothetical protein
MTIFPEKTTPAVPALNKQTGRAWLNISLLVLQTAAILPLLDGGSRIFAGGADAIHCVSGMLLLTACGIHLMGHGRWVRTVILNKPKIITPTLRRQRWLFWAMLFSGLLCGSSGLVTLHSARTFSHVFCLVTPIHALSGLTFLGLNIYHMVLQRNWFLARIGAFFRIS